MNLRTYPSVLRQAPAVALALFCLTGSVRGATTPTASLSADSAREERLQLQGLETNTDALLWFLEVGFDSATRFDQLPARPPLKSQVAIDAMVVLSRRQATEAAPLFEQLAGGEITPGIESLVRWDGAQQRPESRVEFESNLRRTLRLNAIVGLGLVGELRNAYALILEFRKMKDPELKIPCALALATLGSGTGMPYLIQEVRKANRTSSPEAAEALRLISGRNYGPGPDDPVSRRKQAAKDWRTWWKQEGKTFLPDRSHILARRTAPPIQPNRREPKSVRDLLDCMVYPEEARWTIDPYEAYERLSAGGAPAMDELVQVVRDENANLEIRHRAIVLYSLLAPLVSATGDSTGDARKQAYRVIRGLRWDRNPEIREVAAECARRLRK